MSALSSLNLDEDFEFLLTFLPAGWHAKAKELGALRRCRKIPDATVLLRLLLIHLAEGCSLRETALRAREGGIIQVSDVAIMDRLRMSGDWLEWINRELLASWVAPVRSPVYDGAWRVRLVDGTQVREPGPTGSLWRIHYAVDLPSLHCTEISITGSVGAGTGESLTRFSVSPGDLLVGDRAYGTANGIDEVAQAGGDVLVRFGWHNLPLWQQDTGERFDLLAHLRGLSGTRQGDWPVEVRAHGRTHAGRVCALKRSRQAAEAARKRARRRSQMMGSAVSVGTLEAAGYVFVFTTATAAALSTAQALEFYRGRWQVELVFKRLKSLVGISHLHKSDPNTARSWIQGKLLVALLIEALLRHGEGFSPWGYPLCTT